METSDFKERGGFVPYQVDPMFPPESYYGVATVPATSVYQWDWYLPNADYVYYLASFYAMSTYTGWSCCQLLVDDVEVYYNYKDYMNAFVPGRLNPVTFTYPTKFTVKVVNVYDVSMRWYWAVAYWRI